MKINVKQVLKTINGENLKKEDNSDVSASEIIVNSLLANFPDEQNLSGEEKVKRYILATKIHKEPTFDLDIDELALVKKLVGKLGTPLVVGQVWELLEGKETEKE